MGTCAQVDELLAAAADKISTASSALNDGSNIPQKEKGGGFRGGARAPKY